MPAPNPNSDPHGISFATAIMKQKRLLAELHALPSVIVALSGGADSAYLTWAAWRALGPNALSVTAISASYSAYDRDQVEIFLRSNPVEHLFIETNELTDPRYAENSAERCYFCNVLAGIAAAAGTRDDTNRTFAPATEPNAPNLRIFE